MAVTIQEYTVPELLYSEITLEKRYQTDIRDSWDSTKPDYTQIVNLGATVVTSIIDKSEESTAVLYEYKNTLVLADFEKTKVTFSIAGTAEDTSNHLQELKTLYAETPDSVEGKVKIRFWYATRHGPQNVMRTIEVPKWDEISTNYETTTLDGLKFLMDDFKPTIGGQLVVMHGPPGTGKSFSLRALLYSWRDWCTAEYILDPENLFGGEQGYMADLVLGDSVDEYDEEEEESKGKWRLLILEDSGELLSPTAKQQSGQGLSRLLNLVDGLIGQGLRVLVLITTNEEITKLHPAVSREGRCAAAIKFNPFSRQSAEKWMHGEAPKLPARKEYFTLAELYALLKEKRPNKFEGTEITKQLGFTVR